MSLSIIVEDGSMPTGGNSYASLAAADAYLCPRGLWPVTGIAIDTDAGTELPDVALMARKEAALMRAADYLNSLHWKGLPVQWDRLMAWPRRQVPQSQGQGTVPENTVPAAVVLACMEMAAVFLGGADPLSAVARGGCITSESHSSTEGGVDVIGGDSKSDSYTYANTAPTESYYPQLRAIEPYLLVIQGKARGVRVLDVVRG